MKRTTKKTSNGTSARWVKATVIYRNVYHLSAGLRLMAHLRVENHAMLGYFARYTSPPFRLEMQLFTTRSLAVLRKAILGYRRANVTPLSVSFESCNGSLAHAAATGVALSLAAENRLNAGTVADVVHWLFNMTGFSYVQEAAILAAQAHTALRNVPGWSDEPVFGLAKTKAITKPRPSRKVRS
jgi:hypothetical protein